ncbi:YVTN beta-propeller repeat-containing protein [Sphingobium yanoikuyae]|jgi:YVTN family beta-propeller protein|uniref:YVTN beta-propeller repeat-containing protein n=2 Tax=Sphingomonadaceae TaxID=41297 RepID=A0A084EPL1_SPHYA|nr:MULTISPECIES: YncE family protein [Sphingomonadaceae]EZP77784.1 YVTN beta-propeller repeat-containing protein [Novosphingobium resinovorum]KEZ19903.1 YVTN beta-propeller repeat-containing protein [Sphingobium yanoikuyae]RSU51708.1 YncE family protein [Sphingobium yanoikuyae]
MNKTLSIASRTLPIAAALVAFPATAQQVPNAQPDRAVSAQDRFYTSDQFSNTVSVIDPSTNTLLGVIKLGDPTPANLSPLYRGQLLVHGMGFSPDRRTLAVVSIGSNSVSFIDTATNAVKHTAYVGRSPHEAFFRPDGREVWVSVRGEDYIAVLDGTTFKETGRIAVPNGPGMTIFSPDGKYGYVCSSFSPETVVIDTRSKRIVGRVKQDSPFCPDIAATPDGKQVWLTLKDVGRVMVFDAKPPFAVLKTIDTGPITNHVNIARTPKGQFAYVTVGTQNIVRVFRTDDFSEIASVPVGALPHGLWPSGDGSRMYVGLENDDAVAVIDTATNKVIATIPIGQGPQGVAYVPGAVPSGQGLDNLVPLAKAQGKVQVVLEGQGQSQVSLFDQGQVQILQAAVAGLAPKQTFTLGLAARQDGTGTVEPLAKFMTNPAGAAIVNAVGPIRQIVKDAAPAERRFLVIRSGAPDEAGAVVQRQKP